MPDHHEGDLTVRFESERAARLSRITQAKIALERVIDVLDGTFESALSQAIDRLVQLREENELPPIACAELPGVPTSQRAVRG